jgi:gluconate 2-dehydrogenase gamma chain
VLAAALAVPVPALLASCARTQARTGAAGQAHWRFFSGTEAAFVHAAVARLIPTDDLGPGAADSGVPEFIDGQLAGPYGKAERWYMAGPWQDGSEDQGWQSRLTPAGLYRAAIRAVDDHCGQAKQKPFAALDAKEQDALLHAMEKGELRLAGGVSAKTFFETLWQNTQEGFFADPLYGGNRGFAGWKLVGFPGPRYNYIEDIRHYGAAYPLPVVGLQGREPSRLHEG